MNTTATPLSPGSTLPLPDGHRIPLLGFGVFQMQDGAACERAVLDALAAGYRHIDTAWVYGNEQFVGHALARSGLPRRDYFLTTKTDFELKPAKIRATFAASLDKLRTNYVDLLLIHWPFADQDLPAAWAVLEELQAAGQCRSIGVSNISVARFEKAFFPKVKTLPAVNQIEFHVYNQQRELVEYCRAKGMAIEAYSVLTRGHRLAQPDPVLAAIAAATEKTVPQVMIRYVLQKGIVALVKSVTKSRIIENADVFDFELSAEQMQQLDGLNRNLVVQDWFPKGYY
jgi:diketogulonate reductase-like aldo/keto reductase